MDAWYGHNTADEGMCCAPFPNVDGVVVLHTVCCFSADWLYKDGIFYCTARAGGWFGRWFQRCKMGLDYISQRVATYVFVVHALSPLSAHTRQSIQ